MRGFGFDPKEHTYCFQVVIDKKQVTVWEVFDRQVNKACLPLSVWKEVAEPVKGEFNKRLKKYKIRAGTWTATTPMDRLLGKELCLLVWALEDAAPESIQRIVENWMGLAPEERWWLYSTVNATSNQPTFGKDRGWRKAIRIAFAEN